MAITTASTHSAIPRIVEGGVDLVGLASYCGQSPIQVPTGPAVE